MAYLVIVHVPYTATQTERDIKQEDAVRPDNDTTQEGDLDTGDTSCKDLQELIKEEESDVGRDKSDGTSEDTQNTSAVPDEGKESENASEQNITEDRDSLNVSKIEVPESEEADEVVDKTEVDDDAKRGGKTETVGKTETGEDCETGDNPEPGDSTETSGKMDEGDDTETRSNTEAGSDIKEIKEEDEDEELVDEEVPLTPLFQHTPIHKRVEKELTLMGVDNVDMEVVGHGLYQKFSFVQEDSHKCEKIINRLRGIGVGITAGSSVSVFPSSLHESAKAEIESTGQLDEDSPGKIKKNQEADQKKSQFKKSVKSRLLVAQVVKSVTANAMFTFDYLLLLILASFIACVGLVENSSVVLVASMLISPLMGPILAATFGQVIRKKDLRDLGLKTELIGLGLCLLVGFVFGLVSGGVGLHGAVWGSSDSWPTMEMKSRGMLRGLWVGALIAFPSGAGVAISVLGGNAGSLVGVAISASLLPPACNAGMLWAYSLVAAISPPDVENMSTSSSVTTPPTTTTVSSINSTVLSNTTLATNTTLSTASVSGMTATLPHQLAGGCLPLVNNKYTEVYFCNVSHEAAVLGLVSLLLTLLNICCIILMGILVLKIKEVAPKSAGVDTFWREDVEVARGYYSTAKGESSKSLGRMFLEEYKKLQANQKEDEDKDLSEEESMEDDMATIELHDYLQDVENSPDCQAVFFKLQNFSTRKFAEELDNEYNEAALHISNRLAKKPGVYLAERSIRDKDFQRVYNTIHNVPSTARPGITELRDAFKRRKAPSMFIESSTFNELNAADVDNPRHSKSAGLSNPASRLFRRRKQKVKFEVTKVDEEQELV